MHLTFRNINDAFQSIVEGIEDQSIPTIKTPSRNGPVLQIEQPIIITYTNPRERVLFNQARDANPFMHLYEALWMLAGRNDVAPLDYYMGGKYSQFSDDGKTSNGAYGYRWREARSKTPVHNPVKGDHSFEHDQLTIIIDHLKRKPESRRVVLQMWNVEDDLLQIDTSKDVCCLAGETKFRSPEGDTNIQALAKRFQTEKGFKFPIYSVDPVTGDQRISWMTNAWKVGTKKVYRIKFDDGSWIRITGDHRLWKKKKRFEGKRCIGMSVTECQACELEVGDRVLAELSNTASKRRNTAGYIQFKRNLFKNTSFSNMQLEHREYISMFEPLKPYLKGKPAGFSINHIDGNKQNNKLTNLEQIPNREHFSKDQLGSKNNHSNMTDEGKALRGRKHSKSIKSHWDSMSPETRSAYATKKALRTPAQWELLHEHQSKKSNHQIVSIELEEETTVYDFTVPGRHNAVLQNGVVVHNCNTAVYFSIRTEHPDKSTQKQTPYGMMSPYASVNVLDMTVTNRSNDLIWGMFGANVVHFSFLQEYIACALGIEVGHYNQFSNNAHVYTETNSGWHPEKWLAEYRNRTMHSPRILSYGKGLNDASANVGLSPKLFWGDETVELFDEECKRFVELNQKPFSILAESTFKIEFLNTTAQPMMHAFHCYKQKAYQQALEWCETVRGADWRIACTNWIQKRKANHERKVQD